MYMCPQCGFIGRERVCAVCGHEFADATPSAVLPSDTQHTHGRGHKTCASCGALNGVRAYSCKHCSAPFLIKGQTGEAKPKPIPQGLSRGHKRCPNCNNVCGARLAQCQCGYSFTNKRVEDLPSKEDRVDDGKELAIIHRKSDYIKPLVNDPLEIKRQHKYDIVGRIWESLDGSYRIREIKQFMGVNMGEYDRPYQVVKRIGETFQPIRHNNFRFKTLKRAVFAIINDKNGDPINQKPVLRNRVCRRNRQK